MLSFLQPVRLLRVVWFGYHGWFMRSEVMCVSSVLLVSVVFVFRGLVRRIFKGWVGRV